MNENVTPEVLKRLEKLERIVQEAGLNTNNEPDIERVLQYSKRGIGLRRQAELLNCSINTICNYIVDLKTAGRLA